MKKRMMIKITQQGESGFGENDEQIRATLDAWYESGELVDEAEFSDFVSKYSIGHGRIFSGCPVSFVGKLKDAVECVQEHGNGYRVEVLEDPEMEQLKAEIDQLKAKSEE